MFLLGLLSAGSVLGTVLGLAGEHWWPLDLLAHFPVQYALVLLLAMFIYAWQARWLILIPIAAALLVNSVLIAPLYLGRPAPADMHAPRLSVMLLDVDHRDHRHRAWRERDALISRLRQTIDDAPPASMSSATSTTVPGAAPSVDVIVIQGITRAWLAPLAETFRDYRLTSVARDDGFGIAVLARGPVQGSAVLRLVDAPIPAIEVMVTRGEERFAVLAVHAPPPTSTKRARLRDRILATVGRWAEAQVAHPVVVGNLSATLWSAPLRQILDACRLVTSQVGFGVQGTWPRTSWPLRIPVDQVLHGPSLTTTARAVRPLQGARRDVLRATLAPQRLPP